MLTVDIGRIDPAWSGHFHFAYFEPDAFTASRFRVIDDAYEYEGDFNEVNKDSPLDPDPGWKFRFLDPVKVAAPRRTDAFLVHPSIEKMALDIWKGDRKWKAAADDSRYWETVERTAKAVDPVLTNKVRFGGEPEWVQNDETPTGDGGEPMTFIGQVQADFFTDQACNATLFLFHDAHSGVAVQVWQIG
jgi:hypothetical protein